MVGLLFLFVQNYFTVANIVVYIIPRIEELVIKLGCENVSTSLFVVVRTLLKSLRACHQSFCGIHDYKSTMKWNNLS